MSQVKCSPLVLSALFVASCNPLANSETPNSTIQAVKATAEAQKGVCLGEVFPWLSGQAWYQHGLARVEKVGIVTIETDKTSYETNVSIPDIRMKPANECGAFITPTQP